MWNQTDLTYLEDKSQPGSELNLLIAYHNYVNVLREIISSMGREKNIVIKVSNVISLQTNAMWHWENLFLHRLFTNFMQTVYSYILKPG
jgi:hypothetical protein